MRIKPFEFKNKPAILPIIKKQNIVAEDHISHCKKHEQEYRASFCPICLGECFIDNPHTGFANQLNKAMKRLNGNKKPYRRRKLN